MKKTALMLIVSASWMFACKGDEMELPDVECPATVPTFSMVTAFSKCVVCHDSMKTGAARQKAPNGYNYDMYASAVDEAKYAAHEVYEGEMPPRTSGITLTEQEKRVLYEWALCGTPQ
jgi:uncharacterized membrane protein